MQSDLAQPAPRAERGGETNRDPNEPRTRGVYLVNIDADTIRADQNALIFRINGIRLINRQTDDADVRKMLTDISTTCSRPSMR